MHVPCTCALRLPLSPALLSSAQITSIDLGEEEGDFIKIELCMDHPHGGFALWMDISPSMLDEKKKGGAVIKMVRPYDKNNAFDQYALKLGALFAAGYVQGTEGPTSASTGWFGHKFSSLGVSRGARPAQRIRALYWALHAIENDLTVALAPEDTPKLWLGKEKGELKAARKKAPAGAYQFREWGGWERVLGMCPTCVSMGRTPMSMACKQDQLGHSAIVLVCAV